MNNVPLEADMTIFIFGMALPWLLIAVGGWLGYQLVRQNGRILLRLEAIETRLTPRREEKSRQPEALPLGSEAPDFELPDLRGGPRKLADFRGRDVLLIFFNPQCGFCTKMADDLAALPVDESSNRPVPLVVTTGDANENRKLVEHHGIRCTVLLQEEMKVASKFRAQGTPMGYWIDKEGRIASELTIGREALLKLAAGPPPNPKAARAHSNGAKDYRSVAGSRLKRNGLKSGETAPEFTLPRIDGGELSLVDFRGGRLLLVFSAPDCGPCVELAPRLQEIHQERSDLSVLVVSRGELDANYAKAAELGLTYPIVLQQKWEVSLKYAMFATPIGYLIDERGILASDVAVGIEPILGLAGRPELQSGCHAQSLNGDSTFLLRH